MAKESAFEDLFNKMQKIELEENGIECEENMDESLEEETEAYKEDYIENIRIDQKILSLFQVCRWIQNKELELRPDFQRNIVWTLEKRSLLIESLMLKIPIPSFYFDQDKDEKKTVIDGLQRLSAIYDFINDEFSLKGISYLKDCEGKVFSQLERKYRRRIEDTQFTIYILDQQCPDMVKFDVFRRVNTGGMQLNDQEIRNVLATKETRDLLKAMAQSEEFLLATHEKISPIRMLDQELCLRFLAFVFRYDTKEGYTKKNGTLTNMLDSAILRLNNSNEKTKKEWLNGFKLIMRKCYALFGEDAFIKAKERRVINRALFIAFSIELLKRILQKNIEDKKLQQKSDEAKKILKHLLEEKKYYNAFTSSTSSQENIKCQFELAQKVLEAIDD